jgi:putative flippase GtrA
VRQSGIRVFLRPVLRTIRHIVLSIIDFFHRPFARWIDTQTFRYLACGGSGALLNFGVYFIAYQFIFHKADVYTPIGVISPAIAAAIVAFFISTPYGFVMSRYIVFQESNLKGRVQMFRYLMMLGICMILTYYFIRFFHNTMGIYASVANILTNVIVAFFSYTAQRFFTFKVKAAKA